MPAGSSYHSGHLVPSPLSGLACALIVETSFYPTLHRFNFHRIERFEIPSSICDGYGMPAGRAYHSGHLVPSPLSGLACALIVETSFYPTLHRFNDLPNSTFTELRGFHRAFSTGVACQQGALTTPDTWFRPLCRGLHVL